ncbi:Uncharacterized protein dnm_060220 [Desulfonema magnum]|uniref:Uncharacterized protein n=1 Tax=Desulfonema magnum TaxID=45655 RepID=A0A975BQX4_9BACT|nr:Uncharacterized protein dnm_060220 [Desulfonema magnum]
MRGTKTGSAFSEPWKHFHHPRFIPIKRKRNTTVKKKKLRISDR